MRVQFARIAAVVAMIAAVAGCSRAASHGSNSGDVTPVTRVRVENQAFLDMNVYVVNTSGGRTRLGTVTGNTNSTFVIPDYVLGPANSVSFIVEPIGANRAPISNSLYVQPGTTVVLTIPPNG
jgi:hypothetical protein